MWGMELSLVAWGSLVLWGRHKEGVVVPCSVLVGQEQTDGEVVLWLVLP